MHNFLEFNQRFRTSRHDINDMIKETDSAQRYKLKVTVMQIKENFTK